MGTRVLSANSHHGVVTMTSRSVGVGCVHNGGSDITAADIAEHIGNHEFGSAIRDVAQTDVGKAAIDFGKDVLDAVAKEVNRDDH